MRIVILGAGSVGTNLHHGLQSKGIRAELVHARPLTADPSALAALPQADCYIYAIADNALREVIAKIDAPKALHLLFLSKNAIFALCFSKNLRLFI